MIKTEGVKNDNPTEYPVAICLNAQAWLVSDGYQTLHLVKVDGSAGDIVASYQYIPQPDPPSLRLHAATITPNHVVQAVLSYRVLVPQPNPDSKAHPAFKTTFDVVCVCFDASHPSSEIQSATLGWRRRGDSIPLSVEYDPVRMAYLLIGGSSYKVEGEPEDPMDYVPSADEIAPLPRAGEQLDSKDQAPPPIPPYSWTQTPDSVTVAIPLPSSTASSAIRVTLNAKHLSLLVANLSSPIPLPRYIQKEWWAEIDASSSFWTWDKEGDRQKGEEGPQTVGLLTLHLEKRHEGTRWSHVFHSIGTANATPDDVEVPETVDASEMWHIREQLEKYTASLRDGSDASGLGLGTGVPSLGQGEYDEEVDAVSGTHIYVTWIPAYKETEWIGAPWASDAVLLSRALSSSPGNLSSLVIKHDVDGLLYDPPSSVNAVPNANPATLPWKHSSTFSAIAFVLASKRDLRFVYHISDRLVLAFEGGSRVPNGGENAYIYRAPATPAARSAEQAILRIGGGSAGALLGACAIPRTDGKVAVVCLCEKKLVVLPDL